MVGELCHSLARTSVGDNRPLAQRRPKRSTAGVGLCKGCNFPARYCECDISDGEREDFDSRSRLGNDTRARNFVFDRGSPDVLGVHEAAGVVETRRVDGLFHFGRQVLLRVLSMTSSPPQTDPQGCRGSAECRGTACRPPCMPSGSCPAGHPAMASARP